MQRLGKKIIITIESGIDQNTSLPAFDLLIKITILSGKFFYEFKSPIAKHPPILDKCNGLNF